MTVLPKLPSCTPRKRQMRDASYYESLYQGDQTLALRPFAVGSLPSVNRIWSVWRTYCDQIYPNDPNPLARLRSVTRSDTRRFMHWYLDGHNITKLSAMFGTMRHWRMMFSQHTRCWLDQVISKDITGFIAETLKPMYSLSEDTREKPVVDIDDTLAILHHHHAISNDFFSHERERIQVGLFIVFVVSTTARPATLIEGSAFAKSNESLKYKDIQLFKVRDPEDPLRSIFMMIVRLRLYKGKRDKGLPKKIVFCERDDTLSFCAILQVVGLAFTDKAFASEWIQRPEDLYDIHVPDHRKSIPLEWKPCMVDVPLFRRAVYLNGKIEISPTRALPYSTLSYQLARLGKAAGFSQPLTMYSFRRGGGESLDRLTNPDMRNFVMGHARASIFERSYRNNVVQLDTQSAFLEVPSKDALIKLAGHMSLTRDPAVASAVKIDTAAIMNDPHVRALAHTTDTLRKEIISSYGSIKNSHGSPLHANYATTRRALHAAKAQAQRQQENTAREAYFSTVGSRYIDEQRRGMSKAFYQPRPDFAFPERERLASLLFESRNIDEMSEREICARRIEAMNNIVALCGRHLPRPAPRRRIPKVELLEEESVTDLDSFPLVCPGTQCLFCLGDVALSFEARSYSYSRKDALRRHVSQHLCTVDWLPSFICPHPACDEPLTSEPHFLNHAATVHNVFM